ncbi:MAG TPA: dihydroorotase, partial [Polymorphobacter sp.]|nr:dihydroorotase [Polymorphobacter sp.]
MSNGHPVTAFINTQLGSVLVANREIVAVGAVELPSDCQIIDAKGLTIAPGLIDAGVFKADWRACHAGGITRVMLMPDQKPPLDNPAMIGFAWGATKPHIWVHPLAAATRGLLGAELAEIGLCQAAGAVGVATGRAGIADSGVMF